ncbi:hypothetical protein Tco_0290054 [Tanacetum coccineum]
MWRSNHFIGECPKSSRNNNQKAFIGGAWSDSGEDEEEKAKDKTCLVAQASNEICLGINLEPGEWNKDSGCSKHMTDEPIDDAWTRFKNLIKIVHHHGLDLWSLTQFFYDHVDDYTRMDLDFAADEDFRELSGEEAWEAIENFAQGQKEWDNPPNIISK